MKKIKNKIESQNIDVAGMRLHNPVFFMSATITTVLVVSFLIFGDMVAGAMSDFVNYSLRWLQAPFSIIPTLLILLLFVIAISPLGKIRLGGDDAVPEFGTFSWLSMLFAAGMGIGFMFYGAVEPLAHFTGWAGFPLNSSGEGAVAKSISFSATLFHWCLSPWAIYAVFGLALAYFAYSRGAPLTIRSIFYPLLGDSISRWPGHLIDCVAIIATIFGLATTIGIAAIQTSQGLNLLSGLPDNKGLQLALVGVTTILGLISVLRGMNGGVKLLSNINMVLAALLLLYIIIFGPTFEIITGFFEHSIGYIKDFPKLTNFLGREDVDWMRSWTIFYWAWWISWSPFVGMFIAKISEGRTVREFVFFVLAAPSLIGAIWFSAFGETAIGQYLAKDNALSSGITEVPLVLFQILQELPLSDAMSIIAMVLLIVFIVTSVDSGALVIDTISAGGLKETSLVQRGFWAVSIGAITFALIFSSGVDTLKSLQTGVVGAAIPFSVVLILASVSLVLGLLKEHKARFGSGSNH